MGNHVETLGLGWSKIGGRGRVRVRVRWWCPVRMDERFGETGWFKIALTKTKRPVCTFIVKAFGFATRPTETLKLINNHHVHNELDVLPLPNALVQQGKALSPQIRAALWPSRFKHRGGEARSIHQGYSPPGETLHFGRKRICLDSSGKCNDIRRFQRRDKDR